MSLKIPDKCIVDTNVPITANRATDPASIEKGLEGCVQFCVEAIVKVMKDGGLVIDAGDEIFAEYSANLKLCGQPGLGHAFLKWVHDKQWGFPEEDRVAITRDGSSYKEFPNHDDLSGFDNSDRKFVAVANAHPESPTILQATDSKWWGWKTALAEVGVTVLFLCPDYVQSKYKKKITTRKKKKTKKR